LKYTHNGYDFDVLFNTPITFPITWHNSDARPELHRHRAIHRAINAPVAN
jgi:hypothetical protein